MKKQKNFRKFVSLVLCFVMSVSVFSVLSFADADDIAVQADACALCGGHVEWLPFGDRSSSDSHKYTKSDGTPGICTITIKRGGNCLVCMDCGTVLVENPYIESVSHDSCGL